MGKTSSLLLEFDTRVLWENIFHKYLSVRDCENSGFHSIAKDIYGTYVWGKEAQTIKPAKRYLKSLGADVLLTASFDFNSFNCSCPLVYLHCYLNIQLLTVW